MKEILKYIGLTLIFFMVYSCSGGEDILQEGPEEDPFKDYCLVTIEHSGKSFGFLEFTGSKLSGNIQWEMINLRCLQEKTLRHMYIRPRRNILSS